MKWVVSLKDMKELLRSEKIIKIILFAGAALILLLALGGLFSGSGKTVSQDSARDSVTESESHLEERLEAILSRIEGIGNVSVMVTIDTAQQTEYGKNAQMITSVTAPKVRGVAVVCDGGDNITIKEKVISAVSGVLGISSARVSVTA